jgi:AcrR family transcriptional regulator
MDDIAHNLGVSKRTLYELFEDKMNLLKLCMLHYFETRNSRINAKISECNNVLESILTAFDLFLVEGATEQRMQTNLRRFYPALYDELSTMMQVRNRDRLRAAFQKGVDEGLLDKSIDVDLAVAMLGWSLSGVVDTRQATLPSNITPEYALRYVVINFLRGISTVKGMEIIDTFLSKFKKPQTPKIN